MFLKLEFLALFLVISVYTSHSKNVNLKTRYSSTAKIAREPIEYYEDGRALKKHPGCLIWWFLPGCVLGDRISVDPLGIYPWKKFCRKYSDLQKHEACKDIIDENRHNVALDIAAINPFVQEEETKIENHLGEESSISDINIEVPETLEQTKGHANKINDVKKPKSKEPIEYFEDGRALKKHPGCLIWWFLPGCPLGDRMSVDPFGIYPWKKFCKKYSDLQKHEACKKYIEKNRDNVALDNLATNEFDQEEENEKGNPPGEESSISDINNNVQKYDDALSTYIKDLEGLETLEQNKGQDNKINDARNPKSIRRNMQRPKRSFHYKR